LTPCPRNARTHSKKQIRQIADSIAEFGFTNPVLVDRHDMIVAGHGRVEAARLLGRKTVPIICLEDLTEAQIRAYVIADNKLAENAGWDGELLGLELRYLSDLDVDFDATITGFEVPEIDLLIAGITDAPPEDDPADEIPEIDETNLVSQPGDLWRLGRHRLFCGDATQAESYERILDGAKAQMIFTDPPYNVPIDGHVCGLGSVKHAEFAMATGEMSPAQFTAFLETVFIKLADHSVDGAIHYICMDWRHLGEVIAAGNAAYSEFKNLCVWAKTNGGMGSLYRSQHELVFVFKVGTAAHINNVELGKHGRYRTNVWSYAGINSFGAERDADLAMHPTVKPVALVADTMLDCSWRGGIVLDAFSGSGTTIIAAERTGRRGYAIEIDPAYVDVAIKRYQQVTGEAAIHADTGLTFDEIARQRTAHNSAADTESASQEVEHVEG
jgi:16S rRNA G966 N2-methylase RsmD